MKKVIILLLFSWTSFALEVNLDLYLVGDTLWTKEQVFLQVEEAASVFSQCDLKLSFDFHEISSPANSILEKDEFSDSEIGIKKVASQTPKTKSIRAFFFDKVVWQDRPQNPSTAFSRTIFSEIPQSNKLPKPLVDTLWIPFDILTSRTEDRCRGASYSTFAHELAHILTKLGSHFPYEEANTLSLCSRGRRNNSLTANQCQLIHKNFGQPLEQY